MKRLKTSSNQRMKRLLEQWSWNSFYDKIRERRKGSREGENGL